jgi:peptidyl-prolyl cis-trans isomerase SDCCAG10
MSQIYHTEPGTQGKVVLKTNHGAIDIELWPKEAPLACRNFVQLCLEGYFDHTSVHRIIKGFMMQMGDPTGTGKGGTSIWGRPFKDEIHGRIHFNHRGQIAMANENAPHTNQSSHACKISLAGVLSESETVTG